MDNTFNNSGGDQNGAVALPKILHPVLEYWTNYQPNTEEIKLFAECNRHSNAVGGLVGALCGATAYQTIKSFNMKVHPTLGMYPKVGTVIVFGFFLGKFTAIPACYEKFKDLPDSPIGAYLKRKNSSLRDSYSLQSPMESITPDTNLSFPINNSPSQYSDDHMNSAIDIDVYSSPSSMDSYTGDELNGPSRSNDDLTDQNYPSKPTMSYAELRKRHREESSRGDKGRYDSPSSGAIDATGGPPIRRSSPAASFEEKNKYGDVWG